MNRRIRLMACAAGVAMLVAMTAFGQLLRGGNAAAIMPARSSTTM